MRTSFFLISKHHFHFLIHKPQNSPKLDSALTVWLKVLINDFTDKIDLKRKITDQVACDIASLSITYKERKVSKTSKLNQLFQLVRAPCNYADKRKCKRWCWQRFLHCMRQSMIWTRNSWEWGDLHNYQLFIEIEVNSGSLFTEAQSGEVNIPKATVHRDWKE